MKDVYIGQVITILEFDGDGKGKTEYKYKIDEIYSNHVLCKRELTNGNVIKRCVCLGDLVVMGLARQNPILEALRH